MTRARLTAVALPDSGMPEAMPEIRAAVYRSRVHDRSPRDAFAAAYPTAWRRIEARRAFMSDALGITLHPDVLPLSNIPAYLPPFLLALDQAMTLGEQTWSGATIRDERPSRAPAARQAAIRSP